MRWIWIDRIVELVRHERICAVKHVSLAEPYLHDHFAERTVAGEPEPLPARPVMPASLIIEGMAQSAGILVANAGDYAEKVILAKIVSASVSADVPAGCTIVHHAEIRSMTPQGAATGGEVSVLTPGRPMSDAEPIGTIDLVFSHLDNSGAAAAGLPEHNFVLGSLFKTLLRTSGIRVPDESERETAT